MDFCAWAFPTCAVSNLSQKKRLWSVRPFDHSVPIPFPVLVSALSQPLPEEHVAGEPKAKTARATVLANDGLPLCAECKGKLLPGTCSLTWYCACQHPGEQFLDTPPSGTMTPWLADVSMPMPPLIGQPCPLPPSPKSRNRVDVYSACPTCGKPMKPVDQFGDQSGDFCSCFAAVAVLATDAAPLTVTTNSGSQDSLSSSSSSSDSSSDSPLLARANK